MDGRADVGGGDQQQRRVIILTGLVLEIPLEIIHPVHISAGKQLRRFRIGFADKRCPPLFGG
jgi:hypothetical protein